MVQYYTAKYMYIYIIFYTLRILD